VKPIGWLVGLTLLLGAIETPAREAETWQAWRYSRPLLSQASAGSSLLRVPLSADIYAHAQSNLADLRVIDEAGVEVPFVLHAVHGAQTRSWRNVRLTDVGFVPGRFTQVIVDGGDRQEQHNLLELEFDEADFFSWAEIAASDDRTTWRIIRDRAPLYRFREDGVERVPNIAYPQTYARWLRVRILEKDKKRVPKRGRVAYEVVESAERTPSSVTFTKVEPSQAHQSQWQADLVDVRIPLSAVRFEATQPEFHRAVRIATSADGNHWTTRCRGDIYRYRPINVERAGEPRDRTSLEILCPEDQVRFWRVTVLDRDDAPIVGLRLVPEQVTRSIIVRQDPSHSYRVLYGHGRAKAAQYELGKLLSASDLKMAAGGRLGPEELTRNHVSAEPWTERHAIVLWAALLIVVAVLGVQAVRVIR